MSIFDTARQNITAEVEAAAAKVREEGLAGIEDKVLDAAKAEVEKLTQECNQAEDVFKAAEAKLEEAEKELEDYEAQHQAAPEGTATENPTDQPQG